MGRTLRVIAVLGCLLAGAGASDNVDYWLRQGKPAASQPVQGQPTTAQGVPSREDALPGVVELSNGEIIAGYIYTTRDKSWEVFVNVDNENRWRLLPPLVVLSITAIVDEESTEPQWRWQATGQPERVYSGQEYPFRRLRWRFRLLDGSEVTGTVKGQPLWVERDGRTVGPMVLHERDKGPLGGKLDELVYVKRVIISRRAMRQAASMPASRPS
jgi:hypothetical protein